MTPRSLADDLRQRDEDSLALLLRRRPDLSHPVPQDITALAARATSGPSLSRCLDSLNLAQLHLLALAAQLSRNEPTTADALLDAITQHIDVSLARQTLADLRTLALIWGPEHSLRVVTGIHDLLASMPQAFYELPLGEPTPWRQHETAELPAGATDTMVATIARRFVLGVEVLLASWGQRPVRALAKGGLPAKDLAALQELVDWDSAAIILGLEIARAARLITRDADQRWLPTAKFDRWLGKDVGQRWVPLVDAWLSLPKLATADEVVPLDDAQIPGVIAIRRATLEILEQAPVGNSVTAEGVCAVLNFRYPRRRGPVRDRLVESSLAEAALLGVIASGGLTTAGRLCLQHHASPTDVSATAVEACIDDALPAPAAGFFIQSDLTIIAPGPLPLTVEAMVRRIAHLESAEPATVARITAQTLLDSASTGLSMAEVDDFLQRHSLVPVPQALTYLIGDAARRCAEDPPELQLAQRASTPKVGSVRVSRLQDRIPDLARALANSTHLMPNDQTGSPPVVLTEPSAEVLANVRAAIDQAQPIWVAFAEADGAQVTTLVDPIRVESGAVVAMDLTAGRIRTIATARITGTAPLAAAAR